MDNLANKPARLFCKYGYATTIEQRKGGEDMYNLGTTIKERCDKFYSEEEIKQMEDEVKNVTQAECVICSRPIISADRCFMCSEYHKFHTMCLNTWWRNPAMKHKCPLHPREVTTWKSPCPCMVTDWYGGGKKRLKKSKKARKSRKIKKKTKRSTRKKKCNKKKRL